MWTDRRRHPYIRVMIFDDLGAEQDAIESVLSGLTDEAWRAG